MDGDRLESGLEYLLDEELDTGGVPLPDGSQQGGDAMLVCRVDVCPLNNFMSFFAIFEQMVNCQSQFFTFEMRYWRTSSWP